MDMTFHIFIEGGNGLNSFIFIIKNKLGMFAFKDCHPKHQIPSHLFYPCKGLNGSYSTLSMNFEYCENKTKKSKNHVDLQNHLFISRVFNGKS